MENAVANTGSTEVAQPNTAPATEEASSGFSVNSPDHNYEVDDAGMLKRVVERAQAEVPTNPAAKASAKPAEKAQAAKRTLTVDKTNLSLTEEERDRWAQKGIANEKRWVEIAREKKQLQEAAVRVNEMEARLTGLLKQFEDKPIEALVQRHGKEKVRTLVEPFLAQEIREEMLPAHEKALRAKDAEIARLNGQIAGVQGQKQQEAYGQEVQSEIQKANEIIIKALNEQGIPRTDFTAAEMADHMLRGIQRKIPYTPEQLASLVREDNILRVAALTEQYSTYAEQCYKSNNLQGVLSAGEAMEDLLGPQVVKTLRYLDLARLKAGQPMVPQQILETPRVNQDTEKKTGSKYMSEDAYAEERKRRAAAIDRGEAVSDW